MKAILFLALVALTLAVAAPLTEQQYEFLFTRFVDQYQKQYTVDQFFAKYSTFRASLNHILAHNAKPSESYKLAMNEFGDLTQAEFKARLGFRPRDTPYIRSLNTAKFELNASAGDDVIDWRASGAVNPIKNQGQCGSCWAFSATAAIEGAWKIKKGRLLNLAEQQLVDCAGSAGNEGCNGGLMDSSFEWLISSGGQCLTSEYPYTARDGSCKQCSPVATLSGYKDVTQGSESDLMSALKLGPVSVAVEADTMAFQFYSSGVLDDASCGTQLDHGITLVGAGVDGGKQYWNVRNSWGTSWGEKGYIRMIRNKNQCGIASMASYPIV